MSTRPPARNPAYSGSQITQVVPNQSNQAFYFGAETTHVCQQYTSEKAPVQWNAIEDPPKQKLETALCAWRSCGCKNGVPPGTPSFTCYKCGRISTRYVFISFLLKFNSHNYTICFSYFKPTTNYNLCFHNFIIVDVSFCIFSTCQSSIENN